jgi:hypothetical protein
MSKSGFYNTIFNILAKGLDKAALPGQGQLLFQLPAHDNVRGTGNYE